MQKDAEVEKQEIKNQDANQELKRNFIAQLQFRKEVSNNNLNDDLRNLAREMSLQKDKTRSFALTSKQIKNDLREIINNPNIR